MSPDASSTIPKTKQALLLILRPLARIMLRHNVAVQEVYDILKHCYVKEAEEREIKLNGKSTVARVAAQTGLNRTAVYDIKRSSLFDESDEKKVHNRPAAVVNMWINHSDFLDEQGEPRIFPYKTPDETEASFWTLVKKSSRGIPPRTILDDLLAAGMVELGEDKSVRLTQKVYVPYEDKDELLMQMGASVADQLNTIDYNLQVDDPEQSLLQLRTSVEVYPEVAEEWLHEVAKLQLDFIVKWDGILEERQRNHVPSKGGTGGNWIRKRRVGMGLYLINSEIDQE